MRSMVILLIVALGLAAGAVSAANASHCPADLWERLQREAP